MSKTIICYIAAYNKIYYYSQRSATSSDFHAESYGKNPHRVSYLSQVTKFIIKNIFAYKLTVIGHEARNYYNNK